MQCCVLYVNIIPIGAQIVGKLLVTPSGTYTRTHSHEQLLYIYMSIDWKEVEIGKPSTEKRSVVFKAMFKCVDYNSLGHNNAIPVAHVRVLRKVLVLPERQR